MKKILIALIIPFAVFVGAVAGDDKPAAKPVDKPYTKLTAEEIPGYLQDISVTIHADGSQGSGVVVTRNSVNYVLTAGHVVEHLRKTRSVIDPKTGHERTKIEFNDAKVVKEVYDEDGRSVGRLMMDAEVIRYSDHHNNEDLALLRLRKKDFIHCTAHFDKKGAVPVGTDLLHVGSLLGQQGSNSLTTGVVSQTGRVLNNTIYDQSTCAAFPGSSGGGLYRKADGSYVGMLVRGAGETFNLYVPMRRISKWADRTGVAFILDDTLPVPDDKTLRSTPIEEAGSDASDKVGAAADKAPPPHEREFPFLIKRTFPVIPLAKE